jgi:hypothetical protein
MFPRDQGRGCEIGEGSGVAADLCELVSEGMVLTKCGLPFMTVAMDPSSGTGGSCHSCSSSAPFPHSKVSTAWSSQSTLSWLSFHGDFARDAGVCVIMRWLDPWPRP